MSDSKLFHDAGGSVMPRAALLRCHYFRDTRVRREVDALLDSGFTVEVLCLREPGEPRHEQNGRLHVTRVPLAHQPGAPAWRLLAEYLGFFVVSAAILAGRTLRRRFDLVQVNSVPDALVFAALPARRRGAAVVLDLQEPMPEFFATKFGVAMSHPLVGLIARLEQASIRAADAVITPTEPMRRAFCDRGGDPNKISVVMDGADDAVFRPLPARPEPGPADRPAQFIVVSHGTIEPQYGLDTVIRAVALLAEDIPELKLHIIGDGSQRGELQQLTHRLGLAHRVLFSDGFIPEPDLVAALQGADVGVVAMKRDRFRDLTLPGKLFDFVAVGLPMALSRTQSVTDTLGADCYEGFDSEDPHDLAAALRRLHDDPPRANQLAAAARDRVRPIAWEAQRRRYQTLLGHLIATPSEGQQGTPPPEGAKRATP